MRLLRQLAGGPVEAWLPFFPALCYSLALSPLTVLCCGVEILVLVESNVFTFDMATTSSR